MAVSLSGTLSLSAVLSAVEGLDLSVEKKAALSKAITQTWTSGVGVGAIDRLFIDERTISGSATDSLDFNGGGLVDVLGAAWAPARIKFLIVQSISGNALNIQRPASNGIPLFLAASDGIQIPVNGFLVLVWPSAAGIAVTAGTGDLLDIVNTAAGNSVYQIIVGGASA